MCYVRFVKHKAEVYRFAPDKFFHNDAFLNYTVLAITIEASIVTRYPIEIRNEFGFKLGDSVLCAGANPKRVTALDRTTFSFTGAEYLLPGAPLFNEKWVL
jgi:hypothetical protein